MKLITGLGWVNIYHSLYGYSHIFLIYWFRPVNWKGYHPSVNMSSNVVNHMYQRGYPQTDVIAVIDELAVSITDLDEMCNSKGVISLSIGQSKPYFGVKHMLHLSWLDLLPRYRYYAVIRKHKVTSMWNGLTTYFKQLICGKTKLLNKK